MSQLTGAQAHIDLLGVTVRDRVTKFEGVVTSVSFDLYGCIQAAVNPVVDKDGKLPDGRWFDVNRLETIGKDRAMQVPAFDKAPTFGATPEQHTHGPAEKPTAGRRS
jgi:hypothetical protein